MFGYSIMLPAIITANTAAIIPTAAAATAADMMIPIIELPHFFI